jgi:hypothetical protein
MFTGRTHSDATREKMRVAYFAHRGLPVPEPEQPEPEEFVESRSHSVDGLIGRSARERLREERTQARRLIKHGLYPGFWYVRMDGARYVAVITLNTTGTAFAYRRHESVARFSTADEAAIAARIWLKRKTEPR